MTALETANRLTQLAIRTVQQSLAMQSEIATELLRLAVDVLGPDEAIRRIQSFARASAPPPEPNGDAPRG